MRAHGNGDPQVCVQNLLQTVRGEVPFARLKGLDANNIDAPATLATPAVIADATWVVGTYEPRVDAQAVTVSALEAMHGDYQVSTAITDAAETIDIDSEAVSQ